MKNFILQKIRKSIPYVPALKPMAGSAFGCLIMQQLDFYFASNPDGFYKFQSKCDHRMCRDGDTWEDELGISAQEFRTLFDKMGVRYPSKKEWDASTDKFKGKYYACYTDKRERMTYYFRNHEKMDYDLYVHLVQNAPNPAPENVQNNQFNQQKAGNSDTQSLRSRDTQSLGSSDTQSLGSRDTQSPRTSDTQSLGSRDTQGVTGSVPQPREPAIRDSGITENYRETKKQQPQTAQGLNLAHSAEAGSSGSVFFETESQNLIFPEKTLPAEIAALKTILAVCEPQQRQAVLDEVEGKRRAGQVKIGIFPLAASLVRAVASGTFVPSAGVGVAAARQAAVVAERRIVDARASGEVDPSTLDPEIIAKLPPTIRAKMLAAQQKT